MPRDHRQDTLKGLALIAVIAQHAIPPGTLNTAWAPLWLGMAVPVFVVLSGLNNSHAQFGAAYYRRRARRLLVPLAVAWGAAVIVGAATGNLALGPSQAAGALPMEAPGNYFIPVLLQLVAAAPLVAVAFRARPLLTVVVLLAVNLAFELVARNVDSLLYVGSALRYLAMFGVGLVIARRWTRWLWPLAALGVTYLVLEHLHRAGFPIWPDTFARRTNFVTVGLAAALVVTGLRWLPAWRPLTALGRASYHAFLVQTVWFGAVHDRSVVAFGVACAVVSGVGVAFWLADERTRSGAMFGDAGSGPVIHFEREAPFLTASLGDVREDRAHRSGQRR